MWITLIENESQYQIVNENESQQVNENESHKRY